MKPTDPLTLEEVKAASEIFFPLYTEVSKRLPLNASVEDALKVMESVCQLAQKLRSIEEDEKKEGPFGFNKKTEEDETTNDVQDGE